MELTAVSVQAYFVLPRLTGGFLVADFLVADFSAQALITHHHIKHCKSSVWARPC